MSEPAGRTVNDMLELARTAWLLACAALLAVFGWALFVLPERVPQHVDAAGRVTEWGSRASFLAGMGVALLSTAIVGLLARAISRTMSLEVVNIPHKERWLPGHESALRERVAADLYLVGATIGGALAALMAGLVLIALGEPGLPGWTVAIAVVAGVVLAVQLVVMLTVRYRTPAD